MSKIRFQVCEITNGNLKHYYKNAKGMFWLSSNRATSLTLAEAREILTYYAIYEPERNLFIQAEWECHFRETDKNGIIIHNTILELCNNYI